MQHPFDKRQIRNFFLFYGGVVLLMLLFYLLTNFLHTPSQHPRKSFEADDNVSIAPRPSEARQPAEEPSPFRLMPAR